ncbi:MAG: mRNA interferase MazF [Mycobacterium sp.]|jgi:hypothetical protein|nr:mRNA interferase MazF [Mycobacterium sp.]
MLSPRSADPATQPTKRFAWPGPPPAREPRRSASPRTTCDRRRHQPPLGRRAPLTGYANADNIETLGKDELGDHLGALTPETMRRVNRALAIALALAN